MRGIVSCDRLRPYDGSKQPPAVTRRRLSSTKLLRGERAFRGLRGGRQPVFCRCGEPRPELRRHRRRRGRRQACACEGMKGGGEDQSSEAHARRFQPLAAEAEARRAARQFTSIGSGFVIDPSGIVVTNNHVIEGGNAIYVILADGTELKVDKVLGRDAKSDITVLKVTPKEPERLRPVSFGDSSQDEGRRLGYGHRQSVRAGRHRDGRHPFGPRPRYQRRAPTTISCKPTPPSTAAIRAARSSTPMAR